MTRWGLFWRTVWLSFEFASLDLMPALEITTGRAPVGVRSIATWDIRPEREIAELVMQRGFVEGSLRGIYRIEDDERRTELSAIAIEFAETPNIDILADVDRFADASDERVADVTALANRRVQAFEASLAILQFTDAL